MAKYSKELVQKLKEAIKSGLSDNKACDYAGISREIFYRWQRKKLEDGNDNPEYKIDLVDILKKARADKCKLYADVIKAAGMAEHEAECPKCKSKFMVKLPQKQWQAIAWLAERTEFEEFGNKQKVEHSGKDGKDIVIRIVHEEQKL